MNFADETLFGIRVWTLVYAASILALLGMADAALRWLGRRKVRRYQSRSAATPSDRGLAYWLDQGLVAAVPPLTFLIWTLGGYVALASVFVDLELGVAAVARRAAMLARDFATMAALLWLLWRIGGLIEKALSALPSRTSSAWDDALLPVAGTAARLLLPIVAFIIGVQALSIPAEVRALLQTGLSLTLIAAAAFLLYRCVRAFEELVLQRYRMDVSDNLQARAVHTQVTVMRKIAAAIIAIFTLASMLMLFEPVRQLGTSILASAGIAGLIIGFAAQQSIATILAGLQIAITQPIRLDDVVIVEDEWGRIEDITLTYVTVRIWDQRRLVVPITYFIEKPFQNWTRMSAEILGTVFLHVDYRAPLDAIRRELDRILHASKHWDGRVNVLQVTGAREHTLELRALASAGDASAAWDLRCEVREGLVAFLQRHHPESLPRLRAELQPAVAALQSS